MLFETLDKVCPEKTLKISSFDKPWMNIELKQLARRKKREYNKRGRSEKFRNLSKQFEIKYKREAEKFLRKQMGNLMECKPGKAYKVLKKIGSRPGECDEMSDIRLPNHENENLTDDQAAERVADYFAKISQEFPPLNVQSLPDRVQLVLFDEDSSPAPIISEFDVYTASKSANKPKSGVPGDLPRPILTEFLPELATPICKIINKIFQSREWPHQWRMEWITPINKIPSPESEDDLRPISLTAFFSKVTEKVVVQHLMKYIGDQLDFRQYGGIKGNSITHYIIEFINFILLHQDSPEQTAVLACMIDFSKAFNRQNHNILVTLLADMGVPAWLLWVIIAFLTGRKMTVKFRGTRSNPKDLPGGGPQGTILGLLLFLVLINKAGFEGQLNNAGELLSSRRNMKIANTLHLKFVDDMTLAESLPLKEKLTKRTENFIGPASFHERTGHTLPPENSLLFKKLQDTQLYASSHQMSINYKKTKLMLFNQCRSLDFQPNLELDDTQIELVDEAKLLGVVVQSDLKWSRNTEFIVKRAFSKLWMLRRLKELGANQKELLDVYFKQCRSLLELVVPAWHNSITLSQSQDIERVQRGALNIILGRRYNCYSQALKFLDIESLQARRIMLCVRFAKNSAKSPKFKNWFQPNTCSRITRHKLKYKPANARTERLKRSPLSYLTDLLNKV